MKLMNGTLSQKDLLHRVTFDALVKEIQIRNPDYYFDHGLIKVQDWLACRFPNGGAPCRQTVYRLISERVLPGKKIGRCFYIDLDEERQQITDPLLHQLFDHNFMLGDE